MTKFRKKPVVITAEQYVSDDDNVPSGVCFCDSAAGAHVHTAHEGQTVLLAPGDWIVPEPDERGFYPIKPDIMDRTYDRIEGEGRT